MMMATGAVVVPVIVVVPVLVVVVSVLVVVTLVPPPMGVIAPGTHDAVRFVSR